MTHKLDHMHLMRLFVAIIQQGGFANAATHLGITPTKASKDIKYLEEGLKTTLLNRTTRSIHLTDSGDLFYKRATEILELHGQLLDSIGTMKSALTGELRVTAGELWGKIVLTPLILAFKKNHPDVTFIAHYSNENSDLVRDNFHIAFRSTILKNEPYLARHIVKNDAILCASTAYLENAPDLKTPEDLQHHSLITFAQRQVFREQLEFMEGGERVIHHVTGTLSFSSKEAMLAAILDNHGIAALPGYLVRDTLPNKNIIEVLPEYPMASLDFYALYTQRRKESALVNAFIDFVCQEIG